MNWNVATGDKTKNQYLWFNKFELCDTLISYATLTEIITNIAWIKTQFARILNRATLKETLDVQHIHILNMLIAQHKLSMIMY